MRRLASLALLALAAASRAADTWDLAYDFSLTSNPNGVWSYGESDGGIFSLDTSAVEASNFHGWSNGSSNIWRNLNTTHVYQVDPYQVGLQANGGNPDVRWIAPYTGVFTVDVALGSYDSGPGGIDGTELLVDGVSQTPISNQGDIRVFHETLTLDAGKAVDVIREDRHYYGGNTQLMFTVVGQPVPEPASLGALGLGALGLLKRRRK